MGVRITTDEGVSALFDSVSGWAFGPTFDTSEEALAFVAWAEKQDLEDLRSYTDHSLEKIYKRYLDELAVVN